MNSKWFRFFIFLIFCICLQPVTTTAQQPVIDSVASDSIGEPSPMPDTENNANPTDPSNANASDISRMSLREFNLSLIILAFGFIVLLAEFFLLRTVRCNAEQLLRIFGITLIVMGALLIIPAGFNAEAIAPAMGLLGTIAGYLLSQRSGGGGKEPARDQPNV